VLKGFVGYFKSIRKKSDTKRLLSRTCMALKIVQYFISELLYLQIRTSFSIVSLQFIPFHSNLRVRNVLSNNPNLPSLTISTKYSNLSALASLKSRDNSINCAIRKSIDFDNHFCTPSTHVCAALHGFSSERSAH
jgi:hypothetical protein